MPYLLDEHDKAASLFDISRGYYSNAKAYNIFGYNELVGITFETLNKNGGGIYAFPASAIQMSLVSTNAADTMAVRLVGLDSNWNVLIEDVTLNGLTPVVTTNSFYRLNSASILSGVNAGEISITNNSVPYSHISAGLGVSQYAVYSTAANERLYIHYVAFSSGTVNSNKYLFGRAVVSSQGVTHTFWESTWAIGLMDFTLSLPFAIPEKTDFQIQAKSSSSENEVSVLLNAHTVINE